VILLVLNSIYNTAVLILLFTKQIDISLLSYYSHIVTIVKPNKLLAQNKLPGSFNFLSRLNNYPSPLLRKLFTIINTQANPHEVYMLNHA
jgi:hypothetical protein